MVNEFLTLLKGEDAERRTVITKFGDVTKGGTDERTVFVAPHPCQIVAAGLVNNEDIGDDATDYETFSLRDRGDDGVLDGEIGSIATNVAAGAFTAFDEVEFETISAEHRILAEGDVVTLKNTPSGSGVGVDDMTVKLEYKRE